MWLLAYWIAYLLMTAVAFSSGISNDIARRRIGWRLYGVTICLLVALLYLATLNVELSILATDTILLALLTAAIMGVRVVIVRRRAGVLLATLSNWNRMLFFVPLWIAYVILLLPLMIDQYEYAQRYPAFQSFFLSTFLVLLMAVAMGILIFMTGIQKKEIRELGVLDKGALVLWGEFTSFYWQPLPKDLAHIQLVLVRKSWLNLSPNLKCKIKLADQEKIDALVAQHLPRTVRQSSDAVLSNSSN